MAMTKKEREEMERLRRELIEATAFRFTEAVAPDVDVPAFNDFISNIKGFLFNDYWQSPRVEKACSSRVSHAFGRDDQTTTQGPRRLYSSRLLALKALRHCLEKQAAKKLAEIDAMILNELV